MRTVSLRLSDLERASIPIGFVGEHMHTQVRIDCLKLFEEYPTATPSMIVNPPKGDSYPAVVVRDGDFVIWNVTDSDLIYEGSGEIQLKFTVDEVVAKSYPSRIRISRSIPVTGEIPDPVQNWIDNAEDVLEAVEDAIPTGGTTGQVLAKKTNTDYDLEWVDQSGGGVSDYEELTNKPQIAGVTLAGNKSLSDLGIASTSDVSAKYTKPSSGIPASDLASGVIPDVTGKADKVSSATNGNFAGLDSNGNLIDSGHKHSDYLTEHQDLSGKVDKTSFYATEMPMSSNDSTKVADEVNELKSQINVLEPSASDSDVGKVLKAKTVADGKVSEYEFGSLPSVPVTDVQINNNSILSNGVADIPLANTTTFGVVQAAGYGVNANNGYLSITGAPESVIKPIYEDASETMKTRMEYRPLVPRYLKEAIFYGLSKASGDTTQATSNNAVGTYTETALSKISDMLNAPVSVSGSTPSITAKSGVRYICGECSTLSITAPASGDIEVIFESGSTATVLTITNNGVKFPAWFNSASLEANKVYDIIITDATYGVVMGWDA